MSHLSCTPPEVAHGPYLLLLRISAGKPVLPNLHSLGLLLQASSSNYGFGALPPLGGGFSFSSSPQNDKTICTDPR
jgi:hypothetical protein